MLKTFDKSHLSTSLVLHSTLIFIVFSFLKASIWCYSQAQTNGWDKLIAFVCRGSDFNPSSTENSCFYSKNVVQPKMKNWKFVKTFKKMENKFNFKFTFGQWQSNLQVKHMVKYRGCHLRVDCIQRMYILHKLSMS